MADRADQFLPAKLLPVNMRVFHNVRFVIKNEGSMEAVCISGQAEERNGQHGHCVKCVERTDARSG